MKRSKSIKPQRGAARRPLKAPALAQEVELRLDSVGARGDAVAEGPDGPVYAPFALAGERVRARLIADRAEVLEVLEASPERVAPACPHFGACGGCALQHWDDTAQAAWKRELVVQALAKRGIEAEVAPAVLAHGAGRRRATFHAARAGGLRFGFIARGGAEIAAMEVCPLLEPELQNALPRLKRLGAALAPARGEATLQVILSETGLDIDVKGAGHCADFDAVRFSELASLCEALDLARLSFDGEPLMTRRAPLLTMGKARIAPPPGAFLQPTLAGEEALVALALEAVAGAGRVADLFCGLGTFALRFAQAAEVLAVESEAPMLEALKRAADGAGGVLKQIVAERRDLLRTPISALELKRMEAIAFDPPRCGARMQAEQIAASKASKACAISCDAATFARDLRVLVDGGFRVTRVTPVDQFRWSPHVEIVAALER